MLYLDLTLYAYAYAYALYCPDAVRLYAFDAAVCHMVMLVYRVLSSSSSQIISCKVRVSPLLACILSPCSCPRRPTLAHASPCSYPRRFPAWEAVFWLH